MSSINQSFPLSIRLTSLVFMFPHKASLLSWHNPGVLILFHYSFQFVISVVCFVILSLLLHSLIFPMLFPFKEQIVYGLRTSSLKVIPHSVSLISH
jgi:hypothetical protein